MSMGSPIQARLSQADQRLYDANRDLAHCFGEVVRLTNERLEDQHWPYLREFCAREGVSLDDLGEACKTFALAVVEAAKDPKEVHPGPALERCGFHGVNEAATFAYMATLGTVCLGYFWAGAKSATLGGVGPVDSMQFLRDHARETSRFVAMPRWRRALLRTTLRLRLAAAAAKAAMRQ